MPLVPLNIEPGVVRDLPPYASKGRWTDADKVRFKNGRPLQIGGWANAYPDQTYLGVCRSLFAWHDLVGSRLLGIGTHMRLHLESGARFTDITPIVHTVTLGNNPLRTRAAGSRIVEVTDTTRQPQVGDSVTLGGSMPGALDGIPTTDILREHSVTGIVSATVYEITVATAATTGNVTGGGASITAAYALGIGHESATYGLGYGIGRYGEGTYGTARATGLIVGLPRTWSMDAFGENLLACALNGPICYWTAASGPLSRAVLLSQVAGASNAPTVATGVMVSSPDRHAIAFGCNDVGSATQDPMLIRWSDQENVAHWTPGSASSAGGMRLSSGGRITAWLPYGNEILVWTDKAMYGMSYSGFPYVFSFRLIAPGVTAAAPNTVIHANGTAYFFGRGLFHMYTGAPQVLLTPVTGHVVDSMDMTQIGKMFAAHNPEHSEIWWFYQSTESADVDRYVIYNYAENVWSVGRLARTAWIGDTAGGVPLAASGGRVFAHETGFSADGAAMPAYIESGDIDIASGDRFLFASRILPDIDFIGPEASPRVTMEIRHRDWPTRAFRLGSSSQIGVFPEGRTMQASIRVRARSVSLRVASNASTFRWRLGTVRLDVQPDGWR